MESEQIEIRIRGSFDSYELFFLKEKTKRYESRDKVLYGVELKEEEGIALRGIKNNRMVFSYTYDKGDKGIATLLENTKMLMPFAEDDKDIGFPGRYDNYPFLELYDYEGLRVDDTQKISLLLEMEKTMLDYDRRIVTTRNCGLQETEIQTKIINSKGLKAEGKKTLYTLFALCVAKDEDEVPWYDWSWAHSLDKIDGKELGTEIAQKAISFLFSKQISTGIYEGILTPQASCEMLGILSSSFLSESLYKNKTMLKDKTGTRYFSDVINIIDSGKEGMGSFPFDGEGVLSEENILVRDGYFEGFLYDTYYGRKFRKISTGNGVRRGVKEPPACAPRGFFIEKGERDIRGAMTDGIVIEELMGTHTANPITGDFSLGAVGHLYKNGIKTPFKGVIFSGNIFELLNNVKEVGTDLMFYGTFGSPSLFIEGIKISGK
jgi:PmbA protein